MSVHDLIAGDIERVGFSTICVPSFEGTFAYTIGLTELGHPELFISGLGGESSHCLFLDIVSLIKNGERFVAGQIDETLCNLPLAFRAMTDTGAEDYCCQAIFYYQNTIQTPTFLQLVITDQHGLFPWQDGYETENMVAQRHLWVGLN